MEKEFLHEELKRVTEWVRFSDSKTTVVLTIYIGVIGGIFSIKDKICFELWYNYLLIGLLTVGLTAGLFFLTKSIFPKIKNNLTNSSCFYFDSVSKMQYISLSNSLKRLSENEIKEQLTEQIYTNSEIASIKMGNVRHSIIILYPTVITALIISILTK